MIMIRAMAAVGVTAQQQSTAMSGGRIRQTFGTRQASILASEYIALRVVTSIRNSPPIPHTRYTSIAQTLASVHSLDCDCLIEPSSKYRRSLCGTSGTEELTGECMREWRSVRNEDGVESRDMTQNSNAPQDYS